LAVEIPELSAVAGLVARKLAVDKPGRDIDRGKVSDNHTEDKAERDSRDSSPEDYRDMVVERDIERDMVVAIEEEPVRETEPAVFLAGVIPVLALLPV